MSTRPDPGDGGTGTLPLAVEWGFVPPRASARTWLADAHWRLALLAAVPALLALAWAAGPAMQRPSGWGAWLSFLLLQPVAEELLFRGVLQGRLLRWTGARRLGPVSWANVGATAGFVALHLPSQPLAWALAVAAPSLVLGHLRERLHSVWPAVVLHALYNAGFGLAAWALPR